MKSTAFHTPPLTVNVPVHVLISARSPAVLSFADHLATTTTFVQITTTHNCLLNYRTSVMPIITLQLNNTEVRRRGTSKPSRIGCIGWKLS